MSLALSARSALLQALVFPGYGLELIDRVKRRTAGHVRLGMGSVYPALTALEDEGLVRSVAVKVGRRVGRSRRYYELTPRGVHLATVEREALAILLRAQASRPGDDGHLRMAERVRRCASSSASVLRLRRRMLSVEGYR